MDQREKRMAAVAAVAAVLGCGGSGSGATSSEPAEEPARLAETATGGGSQPEAPQASPAPVNMARHFDDVRAARDAVVAGDLDGVRGPFARIADTAYGADMPVSWHTWVGEMQAVARDSATVSTLGEAAHAIGELGTTCGGCHQDTGGGPDPEREDAVPRDVDANAPVTAQMQRHAWATDQLWLGLTAPSRLAWMRGAQALADTTTTEDQALGISLASLREIGIRAVAARPHGRAAMYAEILTTCADCHTRAGD